MIQLFIGVSVLLFGLFVGGAGLVSAGIGVAIPTIPLGAYLTYRGWRIYECEKKQKRAPSSSQPIKPLETTKVGKTWLGALFILTSLGTSEFVVGSFIFIIGIWFIYEAHIVHVNRAVKRIKNKVIRNRN